MIPEKKDIYKKKLTILIKEALQKHQPKTLEETEQIVKSIMQKIEKKLDNGD